MASLFSNMVLTWWFKAFTKPEENPIIKWWVENDYPWDYLSFLDDGLFFNKVPVSEKDVLIAWMSIGQVHNGIVDQKQFLKQYNKEFPPVSRKRKILATALLLLVLVGFLYAITLIDAGGLVVFAFMIGIINVTVISAYDYHNLYRRLICGRKLSRWSPLKMRFLPGFIVAAFIFGIPSILCYMGINPIYYVDISNYPILLKMLLEAATVVLTILGMLLVFEIFLRASLKLIKKKLAM